MAAEASRRIDLLSKLSALAFEVANQAHSEFRSAYLLGLFDACRDALRDWDRCTEDRYDFYFNESDYLVDGEIDMRLKKRPLDAPTGPIDLRPWAWKEYRLIVDVICDVGEIDANFSINTATTLKAECAKARELMAAEAKKANAGEPL